MNSFYCFVGKKEFFNEVAAQDGVSTPFGYYSLTAFYRLLVVFRQKLASVDLGESFPPQGFPRGLDCILSYH